MEHENVKARTASCSIQKRSETDGRSSGSWPPPGRSATCRGGNQIVEDVKGYRDPQSAGYAKFVIKRKMFRWFYGIAIKEV